MKKLNNNLVKYIIKTNFFILNNKKLKKNRILKLTSNKNVNVLDVIELHFSVKQFIRGLLFIKKMNFLTIIFTLNNQFFEVLKQFFSKNSKTLGNVVSIKNNPARNLQSINNLQAYCLLNMKHDLKNELLTFQLNSNINKMSSGDYKIFNSVNSFSKLIFILSIFYNVLKIKKNEITK